MVLLFPHKGEGVVSPQLSVALLSLPLGQIWAKSTEGLRILLFPLPVPQGGHKSLIS